MKINHEKYIYSTAFIQFQKKKESKIIITQSKIFTQE
jgi:hypothetical protein